MGHPSGTVTFLFTDVEGSTRRWEADPEAMRGALAEHDRVLRSSIEGHGGFMFKHTGDGVIAAFSSARSAIDAAVEAQRQLALPVRMGIATGEAEERDGDYFGPVLNRAARVMAAGHGGQVLAAGSTAMLLPGADLLDLGEHRLRDLSGVERIFQVRAEGLQSEFGRLRTIDAVPGNLPAQVTSFVGREVEVKELVELVRAHRMVTLTGVGGVGKTRLAIQVAAELVMDFGDGVWLVELAPVGDPAAVADVVATNLGIAQQAGLTVVDSIAQALAGRRLLIVLDNCEHLLDASADLVERIIAATKSVSVLATSREGLRVLAEQLWPVPSMDVRGGTASSAVELFVERARAVRPDFDLRGGEEEAAVIDICRRLDGIALAIELAAARMVSMSAVDVRDRLGDRFRLLAGSRRGIERHQTLRHAVAWSYDLLHDDERTLLNGCSVFADGFDLAAVAAVCGDGRDEYSVLDTLDSLVRKSLITVERPQGRTRYAMLETIRQFAEEQLAASADTDQLRDRHASYFAGKSVAHWQLWDGPQQEIAVDWLEAEFANLRAGFRWALDRDLPTAAAIAAHTTLLAYTLQRFEPVGWAEEVLAAPDAVNLRYLPRVYVAAAFCQYTGRVDAAVRYGEVAVELEQDPRYEPFAMGWDRFWLANAVRFAGRIDRFIEFCSELALESGIAGDVARSMLLYTWPVVGPESAAKAREIADETLNAARAHGNPFSIAMATMGYSRAFAKTEPQRALKVLHDALSFIRLDRVSYVETLIVREAAALEALHGRREQALEWFDVAIDSFHRAGNVASLATALAYVVELFGRMGRPEIAATIFGSIMDESRKHLAIDVPAVLDHLRAELGTDEFERCLAAGAATDRAEAVRYARAEMARARRDLEDRV